MIKLIFVCALFGSWIGSPSCLGSPIPTASTTVVIKPSVENGLSRGKTEKPRCLLSLFGLGSYDDDSPPLPDFNSSPLPNPGLGLQGGILSNNNGFGGTGIYGSSTPGLGVPSQYTPGLGQASNAYKHAQGLESQLYGTQYQINSQLAGVPGSGIPLSPGYLRNAPGFGVTSLAAPPTIFYK